MVSYTQGTGVVREHRSAQEVVSCTQGSSADFNKNLHCTMVWYYFLVCFIVEHLIKTRSLLVGLWHCVLGVFGIAEVLNHYLSKIMPPGAPKTPSSVFTPNQLTWTDFYFHAIEYLDVNVVVRGPILCITIVAII